MKTQLNIQNTIVISRNMIAYWLWHTLVSINAVKFINNALDWVGVSAVSTPEISNPLRVGMNYMTAFGLCYRLYLAISRTNNTREGFGHGAFTYFYNQRYVGILTNRRTLELMMIVGLIHTYYFHGQGSSTDSPIKEFLFKMFLSAAVGYGLDALNNFISFRKLVVAGKIEASRFIFIWCLQGGAAAPGCSAKGVKKIEENIHNPLSVANKIAIMGFFHNKFSLPKSNAIYCDGPTPPDP